MGQRAAKLMEDCYCLKLLQKSNRPHFLQVEHLKACKFMIYKLKYVFNIYLHIIKASAFTKYICRIYRKYADHSTNSKKLSIRNGIIILLY